MAKHHPRIGGNSRIDIRNFTSKKRKMFCFCKKTICCLILKELYDVRLPISGSRQFTLYNVGKHKGQQKQIAIEKA